jgi:urease accessory protein
MAAPTAAPTAALLLLADGRFPSGGHAHSGGLETAVAAGLVHDLTSLASFLEGRLRSAGLVAAGLAAAAAACGSRTELTALDVEADARTPSPALRLASRRQGRQLVRAASTVWPGAVWNRLGPSPHQPIAVGAAAAAAELSPCDAALVAAHGAVSGPATAVVRILALDPLAVAAVIAELAPAVDQVAESAAAAAGRGDVPAAGAPLLDLGAEQHATWEVRLFAS